MYSVYLDTFSTAWACLLLIVTASLVYKHKGKIEVYLTIIACILYLIAQTGWTTAYFNGILWGADIFNYVWFAFNTTVFATLTIYLRKLK